MTPPTPRPSRPRATRPIGQGPAGPRPRTRDVRLAALLAVALLLGTCSDGSGRRAGPELPAAVTRVGDEVHVATDALELAYDLARGTFSVGRAGEPAALRGAVAEARVRAFRPSSLGRSDAMALAGWSAEETATALGPAVALTVTRAAAGLELEQRFVLPVDEDRLVLGAAITNTGELAGEDVGDGGPGGADLTVAAIVPIIAGRDAPGGLLPGADPDRVRVLENGTASYFDFVARILPGSDLTAASWNTAVVDPATGGSVVVGGLAFERGEVLVSTAPSTTPDGALAIEALSAFVPGLTLAPGERLEAEPLLVDVASRDALGALERYAAAVRDWLGIVPWAERHPEIGVPNGWNSWSGSGGSGGSGGYGTDIDEETVLANLEVVDRELRRWGMGWFQIDDGWELVEGDWQVRADRFPDHGDLNGIEWLMGEIRRRGLRPGLWVSPYAADVESRLVREHPGWVAGKDLVGTFTIDDDQVPLDLTHPEVRRWLDELMREIVGWGADWIKLDFGYYFLMSRGWAEPGVTRIEAYRAAHRIVREAIGPDVFFLTVSVVGPTYDLADGNRITLDTMPVWDGEEQHPADPIADASNQGIKPSVRTVARRWYLHDRIWALHPDLIFFRAHADPALPPLTLAESQALCQFVALTGGIVKLGDKLVDLTPEALASIRAILPIHGRPARPLDLFRREYPEVLSLSIPGFPEPYHVLGLTNWGRNRDLTTTPFTEMPDAPRRITVDLAEAGLELAPPYLAWEWWTGTFLGELRSTLALDVPPHEARAVALRPALGRPQLLGTDRHLLGGVGVVTELAWDPAARTLRGTQEGSVGTDDVPFTHDLAFHLPPGFALAGAEVTATPGFAAEDVATRVEPATTGASVLHLGFRVRDLDGPQTAEPFGDVTWTLRFRSPAPSHPPPGTGLSPPHDREDIP